MKLLTLDQFLASDRPNAFVKHPDFKQLYVRYSGYVWALNNSLYRTKTIQLARLEAKKPGTGAFKRLMLHLTLEYKLTPVIVECVQNRQFAAGLLKLGFTQFTNDPSFIINHRHVKPTREGIKPGFTLLDSLTLTPPIKEND